jgi:mono/diheme cytochrome c family protein
MIRSLQITGATIAVLFAFAPALWAQGVNVGEREYLSSCAVCHGVSGRGDGPMAVMIDQVVADLTNLRAENGGVFPVNRVYEIIDGRTEVAWHGPRDMPVWGNEYNAQIRLMLGYDYPDAEALVRARILALIEHIYSLQAQ